MIGETMSLDARMQAAGLRAREAHTRVRRKAEALCEELEDVTAQIGIPMHLAREDSMVISVERVIESHKPTKTQAIALTEKPKRSGTNNR